MNIHTLCSCHTLASTLLKLENTKGLLLWVKGAALEPAGLGCFPITPKYLLCIMICIAHKNWRELWVRSVCPRSQLIYWSVKHWVCHQHSFISQDTGDPVNDSYLEPIGKMNWLTNYRLTLDCWNFVPESSAIWSISFLQS